MAIDHTTTHLMAKRVGASKRSDITSDTLAHLNRGDLETATLVEGLAIDFAVLLQNCVATLPTTALDLMRNASTTGVTARMKLGGELLLAHLGADACHQLVHHRSDTMRGFATYALAAQPSLPLEQRLQQIRPFANDAHFGVREWAWLALRPHLAANVSGAVTLLTPWTLDGAVNIRRFAVESMRPRGVWCSHIDLLKTNPALALPLLTPLRADPEKYVQLSVGNWLNDAAKSQPDFVKNLCATWLATSPNEATSRICKAGCRSLTT
jgi:3-methyladenine DNA glycosylase AlkC